MSANDMSCNKCSKPAGDNDSIKCQGFCDIVVHFKCAGLSSSHLKAKGEVKGFHWLCEECTKFLKNATLKRLMVCYESVYRDLREKHSAVLADVQTEFAKFNASLEKISGTCPNISSTKVSPWPKLDSQSVKRRRMDYPLKTPHEPIMTPAVGTRATTSKSIATVAPPEKKFWIYLARLHNSVTEADIEDLVKECLSCDAAEAHLLVKKDSDLSQLKSVSFKVGVDLSLKPAALDASTWPAGVLFREFEDSGSKNLFRQSYQVRHFQKALTSQATPTAAPSRFTPTVGTGTPGF